MELNREELEDVIPESSTQLVSLNTRIPRFVDKLILECVGILQTTNRYHKVSKQVAIQILIERGYQTIMEDFRRMDLEESEQEETPANISLEIKSQQPQNPTFNINSYYEMSNKSLYTSRQSQANSVNKESAKMLQAKLGLKG